MHVRPTSLMMVLALAFAVPTALPAQSNIPVTSMSPPQAEPDLGALPGDFETGVSFLDSAVPRSTLRLRYDMNQRNFRPTRAEFHFPADAFRVPETRIDTQELHTYVEYGLNEWCSTFMETPYKWINPEQNRNTSGLGDLYFGLKFAGWNSEKLMTTFQLRFGANTAQRALTGTGHWSVEPAFLVNWRLMDYLTLEGQVGYYVPMGGTDFAGDVMKYGVGLSYGSRTASAVQLMPVAEIIGWTLTSGKEITAPAPGVFITDNVAGDTIINGCLGMRFTLGHSGDVYAGYSHCFYGAPWYRDMLRLEFRIFY